MTITLSPQTETLLQEQARLFGEEPWKLVDILVLEALEARRQEYEETCQTIAKGLADVDAGRTVSFEDAWTGREARRAARRVPSRDAA